MIESKLLGIKILLVKLILKIDHKKYLLSILCWPIEMVFNKLICMLIYGNQNNGEKMNKN